MYQIQPRPRRWPAFVIAATGLGLVGLALWQPSSNHGPSTAYAQQAATAEVSRDALSEKAIASADQLSAAFRDVAKALKPAVVSIQSVIESKPSQRISGNSGRRGGSRGNGLPQGLPPEFRQFFGEGNGFAFPFDFEEGEQSEENPGSQRRDGGLGSGVIVSPNGFILTNNHVVEGADKLEVRLSDDRKFEAKVVGTDPKIDVAVLKIEATGLVPAKLGDSAGIQVGDWVIAIGSPFGLSQTVTSGIISATHREDVGITQYDDFLQTDAAINPGNSGGPLLNLRGEVIGINTAIASRGGGFNGIGFAIPSNVADHALQSILRSGKVVRGFIGISIAEMNPERSEQLGLPANTEGVYIDAVSKGSPSEKAGLKPGDIVQNIDGEKVTSAARLRKLVANLLPGTSANFSVLRNGQNATLKVTIEEQTDEKLAILSGEGAAKAVGISVESVSSEVASDLGLESGAGGVVVKEVDRRSPAARAVRPGEVILEVNGIKVSTPDDFKAAIGKSPNAIRMLVRNATSTRMVILK